MAAIYARNALSNLTVGVVGGDADGDQNLWNFYWLKTALLDLRQDPYYTDHIYYPIGTSLRFHTFNPLNGLITLPLNVTIGYVPAFNLLMLLALFLTAFFTYLLIKDLVGNAWAAFAGAALFTFANHHFLGTYLFGQTERISAEWLPLYLLIMFRAVDGKPIWDREGLLMRREADQWPLYCVLAVLTLILLSLTDWQFLMQAVLIGLLYGAFLFVRKRPWREKLTGFGKLVLIGGSYVAIVALPLVGPMVQEALANPWLIVSGQAQWHSLDLLAVVGTGLENPGYVALALVLVGAWATLRKARPERETVAFWLLAGIFAWMLALGPSLVVGGQPTDVPMPYSVLQGLPLLSVGRDPQRFYLITTLAIAVLAAFGFRALLRNMLTREIAPGVKRLIPAALVALLLITTTSRYIVEAGEAHVPPRNWPPFYTQLAQGRDAYAILELPMFTNEGKGEATYMAYQVLHHKPRFSGRLARDRKLTNPNNIVRLSGMFRHLWLTGIPGEEDLIEYYHPPEDFLKRTDYARLGVPILNYYNVRYIILYREALSEERWQRYQALLDTILDSNRRVHYEDDTMQVYSVPTAPTADAPPMLDVGDGWFPAQMNEAGVVYRWADQGQAEEWQTDADAPRSTLHAMNLQRHPTRATLSFTIYTFRQPRTIRVEMNGEEVSRFDLKPQDGTRLMSVDITLPPGISTIAFSSQEPPSPTGDPSDSRLLSFGMYGVSVHEK